AASRTSGETHEMRSSAALSEEGALMRPLSCLIFAAGLMLCVQDVARAAPFYRVQPLLQLGDKLSDGQTKSAVGFWVGSLNDSGQIAFVTGSTGGSPTLVQYADGSFTPIVV